MNEHDIQEVENSKFTHIDGRGNKLRLESYSNKRITFLAVGRRNKRAFIDLSPEGLMKRYSGFVKI